MARPSDPYAVFRFVVLIEGIEAGGFSEATGLQAETEVEDYREGGVNLFLHKFVKTTKYGNLTLKRGITGAEQLWRWHQEVVRGKIDRRDITVVLRDQQGNDKWRWVFSEAFPVKWSNADLNATGNNIAVESVEFVHRGIRKG